IGSGVVGGEVEESLRVSLNGGQWSAEFVGDVCDKVATRFFDALGFGEIAEHGDGASIGEWGGGDVEGAAGNDGGGAGGANFFGFGGRFDGGEKIGVANGFDDGS